MPSDRQNARALADLRVVEWSHGDLATRLAARLLGDFGAEVIQLNSHVTSPSDPVQAAMACFADAGKSRRSTASPRAPSVLAAADVLFECAEKPLPLRLERAARENAGLVRVSLSPLGTFGSLSGWHADQLQVCALSGISIALGEPGRPPLHFPFSIPALQASFHAASAALVAIEARERSGRGQVVEISATDILAFYAAGMNLFIAGSGGRWARRGFDRHGPIYPSGFYPCGDGYVFMATQSRKQWEGFLELMGDPDWGSEDPALRDGVAIGWKRAEEVDVHFIPWLTQFSRRELVQKARESGVLILGPINSVHETLEEPHLAERGFWTEVETAGRRIRFPGAGYRLSRTPLAIGPRPGGEAASGEASSAGPMRPDRSRTSASSIGEPGDRDPRADRPASSALSGLRIVEFGWNWAGPLVGQILADFGAEVIKIETSRRLDFMRHWGHARAFFQNANRNKRSITVDIAKPEGVRLVRELARQSDVFFDNFAAGVLARHGLGESDLLQVKPDLVVLSMAMAGQSGPLSHLRGFATIATGFAGIESAIGYPDCGPTGLPQIGLGDLNAAIQAVLAILVALRHRKRAGEGQFIDLSQIEAATALTGDPLIRYQLTGQVAEPCGNAHPEMAPHGTYPTSGKDRWVAIAVRDDREWQALVSAMGSPDWSRAEVLVRRAGRLARREEIDRRVAEWTSTQDRDPLAEKLQAAGVPAAPVLELAEMLGHPHFAERRLETRVPGEAAPEGGWRIYNTPWHFTSTPGEVRAPAPALGADNAYVFGELLGLSEDEIQRRKDEGVIC